MSQELLASINLKQKTLDWLGRKQYRGKSRGTFYPSEASASFINQYGEREIVGKCHRASYYRLKGVGQTNPPTDQNQVLFMLGNAVEDTVTEAWKQAGIWENNSVKWMDTERNISGEFDVICREGDLLYGVECVTPSTLIPHANGEITYSDEVLPGDILVDTEGEPVKVQNIQIKEVKDESIYRFKSKIDGLNTEFSKNHPVYSGILKTSRLKENDKKRTYEIIDCHFRDAENIKPGMYISTPDIELADSGLNYFPLKTLIERTSSEEIEIDERGNLVLKYKKNKDRQNKLPGVVPLTDELLYVFGLYAAEGYSSQSGTIYFSFHKNEKELIGKTKNIFLKYFNLEGTEKEEGEDCIKVHFSCKALAKVFHEIFGDGAHNKKLPFKPEELDFSQAKSLLTGLIDGDGCNVSETQRRLYTVSPKLAKDTFQMLIGLGENPGIRKYDQGDTSFPGCGYIYRVEYADKNSELAIRQEGKVFYRVKSVEEELYSGSLINYEVDGSNTFLAGMIGTHNCKSFYGYFANKQILGHYSGRGANKRWNPGKPKDEHLMQTALYCDHAREQLAGFKIFYVSRDGNDMTEFNVTVDEEGKIFVNGIENQRFTIHDIYARYALMADYMKEDSKPPREFDYLLSDERVQTLADRGDLSATALKDHTSGKKPATDWHCSYCSWRDHCLADNDDEPAVVTDERPDVMVHGSL